MCTVTPRQAPWSQELIDKHWSHRRTAPSSCCVSADDVARRAPPVRRTQHGRAASPMLAQPHRVAASTLCCIAMRACSGLIMRLGAGSHVALAQPHWRPVPCTHADRAGSRATEGG